MLSDVVVRIAVAVFPSRVRSRLRSIPFVRTILKKQLRGMREVPMPGTDLVLCVDAYKHARMIAFGFEKTEPEERRSIDTLLRQRNCRTFWDVGTNIGLYSLEVCKVLGKHATIVCFEPDRANLALLKQTIARNGVAWTVRESAVSNSVGSMTFRSDNESGATGSLEQGQSFIEKNYSAVSLDVVVPVTTLDAELQAGMPVPDFVKIDVEGHELSVLQGATHLLTIHRPAIQIECTKHCGEVTEIFRANRYKLFDERLKPIETVVFNSFAIPD